MQKLFASISFISCLEAFLAGVTVGCGETVAYWYLSKTTENPYLLSTFLSAPLAIAATLQLLLRRHTRQGFLARPVLHIFMGCIGLSMMTAVKIPLVLFLGLCLVGISQIMTSGSLQQLFATMVPAERHAAFFSRRFVITNIATLVCFLTASTQLDKFSPQQAAWSFFCVALTARCVSWFLIFKAERLPRLPSLLSFGELAPLTNFFGRRDFLMVCLLAFAFRTAVNISSTFYSAWLLHDLRVTALSYSALIAVPILIRCWSGYNWGILVDQNKTFDALTSSLLLIALTPFFCAFVNDVSIAGFLQGTSGLGWAGYEFLIVMIVQRMFPQAIMSSLCTFAAVGHLGGVAGGLIGSTLFHLTKSYDVLFLVSSFCRLSTAGLLLWFFKRKGFFRARTLNVSAGMIQSLSPMPAARGFAKVVYIASRRRMLAVEKPTEATKKAAIK